MNCDDVVIPISRVYANCHLDHVGALDHRAGHGAVDDVHEPAEAEAGGSQGGEADWGGAGRTGLGSGDASHAVRGNVAGQVWALLAGAVQRPVVERQHSQGKGE